ncbi:MAG TPA: hypothetical protein VJ821_07550 [Anaerolineales bacterium]|nr:hypothetical protein [Anaerolineales bacterium]
MNPYLAVTLAQLAALPEALKNHSPGALDVVPAYPARRDFDPIKS